jgi:hypothetical protein
METGALHTGCISEVVSETVCFSNAQNSSDEARPSEFNTLHSTIVIAAFDGVDPKISSFVLALYTNRASAVLTDNLLHPHLNIAAIYPKFSVFFSSPPTTQEDKRTTPTEHITKYLALTITALDRNSLALVHVTHNSRYKHCSRIRHIQAP